MKLSKTDFFWPSFADLMTSLFFVMLALFAITFYKQQKIIKDLEEKLVIVNAVKENLKPLKNDTHLFKYQEKYKRFILAFDVKFEKDKSDLFEDYDLESPYKTRDQIRKAGRALKKVVLQLKKEKSTNEKLKDVSYIIVMSGYASNDSTGMDHNYELSYKRAHSLWKYWKSEGIDFEDASFDGLIDLQIAGNGWGGIGREKVEENNQRFIIQIFPKISQF